MFKKLYAKVDVLCQLVKDNFRAQSNEHYETRNMMNKLSGEYESKLDNLSKIVISQQSTIEQLTNALRDKYEHGLFVYSKDGQVIKAIQDGEEISLNRMSYLDVQWSAGEAVGVTIERR